MTRRISIVGAGAVGQVYGFHLATGGALVTAHVRPARHAVLRPPVRYPLYRLSLAHERLPVHFEPDAVVVTTDEDTLAVADEVWLAVDSTALRGDWLRATAVRTNPEATIVVLQPGLDDRALVGELFDPERVVSGMISMVAYQAPLPCEEGEYGRPGVAYWLPPLSPTLVSGPDADRVATVRDELVAGGCAAEETADVRNAAAFGSAVLMPHIVALEGAGWSVAEFRRSAWLDRAAAASKEAMNVVGREIGRPPPAARHILCPLLTGVGAWLAEAMAPFPFEPYMAYHFGKTREQTAAMMRDYLRLGARHDVETPALTTLSADVLGVTAAR